MTVLFIVLPLAIALSALAACGFLWATRAGQFDDLETPAVRLLCDELAEGPRANSARAGERAADPAPKREFTAQ